MKTIKDIRLYKSEKQNEYGIPLIHSFADKELNAIVHRIVMKLRENGFSLGEFDHLYIDFTTCDLRDEINLSDNVDKEHPWYRYCSIKVSNELFSKLGMTNTHSVIINMISDVLITCFETENFNKTFIHSCIQQAMEQGENMLMKYKVKSTSKRKAEIFLRYLDSCKYYPLLRVYDNENNLLFEKDLPESIVLDNIGDIQLSTNKVTIKPKKNVFATNIDPITFDFNE